MNDAVLLGVLVLFDAVFAGFRAAAGRDARLYKVDYYLRSAWLGAIAGALVIAIMSALIAVTLSVASSPSALFDGYLQSARHLLWVYGIYASIVLLAMGMWTYPAPDIRVLASVLVLGPFTLVRPLVIVAGCGFALALATQFQVRALCAAAIALQLSIEPMLNAIAAKSQKR
jgi:hypothetical protein